MPKFIIEYHSVLRDIFLNEAEAIEGVETLDELVTKLENAVNRYDYAIIYILHNEKTAKTFKIDLREFKVVGNGERRQDY